MTESEIIHVDFMTEIQYNVMDLPAFDWTYNKQILNVKTNQGWLRPSECLTKRVNSKELRKNMVGCGRLGKVLVLPLDREMRRLEVWEKFEF